MTDKEGWNDLTLLIKKKIKSGAPRTQRVFERNKGSFKKTELLQMCFSWQ